MAVPLHTPRVNNNDDVVRLLRVLVKRGDAVKAGDIVAEVETDKASFTVEAERPGFVLAVLPQSRRHDRCGVSAVVARRHARRRRARADGSRGRAGGGHLRADGESGSTAPAVRAAVHADVPASDGRLSARDVEELSESKACARSSAEQRPASTVGLGPGGAGYGARADPGRTRDAANGALAAAGSGARVRRAGVRRSRRGIALPQTTRSRNGCS